MPKFDLSIFGRVLLASALTSVLIALGSGLAHYLYSAELISASVSDHLRTGMSAATTQLRQSYEVPTNNELRSLQSTPAIRNLLSASERELRVRRTEAERLLLARIRAASGRYDSIYLVREDGREQVAVQVGRRIRTYRDLLGKQPVNPADEHMARLFKTLQLNTVGTVSYLGPIRHSDGRISLLAGIALPEPDIGGFGGALILELNLHQFLNYLTNIRLFDHSIAWLFDATGAEVLRPIDSSMSLDPAPYLFANVSEPNGALISVSSRTRLTSEIAPSIDLLGLFRIALSMPAQLHIEQRHGAARIALGVLLAAIIFAILTAYWVARQLATPIGLLAELTASVGNGELDERVPENWPGELGALASSFNQMLATLQSSTVSRSYLRNILQSMTDTLAVLNSDGTIRYGNRALSELLGYSESELEGLRYEDVVADEDVRAWADLAADTCSDQRETHYLTRQGRRVPVIVSTSILKDEGGNVEGFVCVARDISDRKRDHEALRRQKNLFEAIFNQVPDAIIMGDLDRNIAMCNPGVRRVFGFEPEELVGQNIEMLHASREEFLRMGRLRFNPEARDRTTHDEASFRRKNGEIFPVETVGTVLRDANGEPQGYIGLFRDVTERRRVETDMLRAKEASEEAARSKSEFLANMSHEIRTPINGVLGMNEVLLRTELNERQRHCADTVRRSAEALLRIINDVLDFSKIEAGKLELCTATFDLRELVEDVGEIFAEAAHRKGVELVCAVPTSMHNAFRADSGRLRQVLTNLVGNALKFTESGEVVVRVSEPTPLGGEQFSLRIEVEDSGIGISEQARSRIFDSFAQADGSTNRQYGGTGLGLSISRQLVELMGGKIGVESTVGRGSTFWFTAELTIEPAAPSNRLSDAHALKDVRILVVDDNPTNREVFSAQLEAWGADFVCASSGAKALQMLAEAESEGRPFELGVLDMHMPEMDGLMLSREISARPELAKLRRVMLSSISDHLSPRDYQLAGIDSHLTKPVRQSELFNCLLGALGRENALVGRKNRELESGVSHFEGKVLLVEDNLINQEVALELLGPTGVSITTVGDGREAVTAWSSESFDLVLMDCQMPNMDGFEATRIIRGLERDENRGHTPIIALTANALAGDRERCLDAGMDDYLTKPLSELLLFKAVGRWLEGSSVASSTPASAETGPGKDDSPTPEVKANSVIADDGLSPNEGDSLVDKAIIAELRARDHNRGRNLLGRLIGSYLEQTPTHIETLRQAIDENDIETVRFVTHSMKSNAATLGATTLSAECAELERQARQGELEAPAEYLQRIESMHQAVASCLMAELAESAA